MVMTVPVQQQSKIQMANGFFEREKKASLRRDRSLATSMIEDGDAHAAAMDQQISINRRASQVRLEERRAKRKKSTLVVGSG